MREELQNGCTFARARERALARLSGPETAAVLQTPNNTLGVEYCKALLSQSSPMRVFTMQRVGASHDSFTSDAETASASYIRSLAAGGMDFAPYMPVPAAEILQAE